MRALLVGAAPDSSDPAVVAALATRHDVVVAVDGGGALCRRAGIVPNVVIGDFDSLSSVDLDALISAGTEVVRFDSHKDQTDLELALDLIRSRGAVAVTLTAVSAGRLDHSLAAVGLMVQAADLSAELYESDLRGWLLSDRARADLDLTVVGATVSLIALAEKSLASVQGALWSGEIELRYLDSLGVSNVIETSPMHVAVLRGTVLVLSPRDDRGLMAESS